MKNSIFITFFLLLLLGCSKPQEITWHDLSKVKFVDKYLEENEEPFSYPMFSESVKSLDRKIVKISGYFLHIYPSRNIYICYPKELWLLVFFVVLVDQKRF